MLADHQGEGNGSPLQVSHVFPEMWNSGKGTFDMGIIQSFKDVLSNSEHSWLFGEFLVRRYLRSTRSSAGSLDVLLKQIRLKDRMYRPRSLQAALSQKWFLIWLLAVTTWTWISFTVIQASGLYDPVFSSTAFRVFALRELSGAASTTPGIQDFGLKLNGCIIGLSYDAPLSLHKAVPGFSPPSEESPAETSGDLSGKGLGQMTASKAAVQNLGNLTVQGPVMMLNFSTSVSMNEWYFTRLNTTMGPERHPVLFRLDALMGSDWVTIGAPSFGAGSNYPVLVEANDDEFSLQGLWQFKVFSYTGLLSLGLSSVLAAFFGAIGDTRRGGLIFLGGFAFHAVASVIAIFLTASIDPKDTSSTHAAKGLYLQASIYAFFESVMLLVYFTEWRRIFQVMFLFGMSLFGEYAFRTIVVEQAWEYSLSTVNASLLCAPLLIQLIQREIRARGCDKLSTSGLQRWSAVWRALLAQNPKGFAMLKETVANFEVKGVARQCNRLRRKRWIGGGQSADNWKEALSMTPFVSVVESVKGLGQAGSADPSNPVRSVSQLFAQAEGLQRFFFNKSVSWAAASEGLMLSKQGELVKCDSSTDRVLMQRPKLKTPRRTIEKILRGYHGDASYLLDLCRGVIVFERVEELTDCLSVIFGDPEAVVVRVKNLMDTDYDGVITAGWRGVIVNLRIDIELTRLLGIETHVCEMQLLLKDYFLGTFSQPASVHQNYLKLRDDRADRPFWRRYNIKTSLQNTFGVLVGSRARPFGGGDWDVEAGLGERKKSSMLLRVTRGDSAVTPDRSVSMRRRSSLAYADQPQGETVCTPYRKSLGGLFSISTLAVTLPASEGSVTATGGPDHIMQAMLKGRQAMQENREDSSSSNSSSGGSEQAAEAQRMWQRFLLSQFLNSTLEVGGFIERKLIKVSNAMASASGASAFFTSRPVANAMTKKWFRFALVVYIISYCNFLITNSLTFESRFSSSGTVFRFTALETRSGESLPPDAASVGSFGLSWNGCSITQEGTFSTSVSTESNVITLVYDKPVTMNGYYLETRSGDAGLDPARWVIEAKGSASDEEWHVAGASYWFFLSTSILFDPRVRISLPLGRGQVVEIDHRIPTYSAFQEMHIVLIGVPCLVVMVVLALLDEYEYQHAILAFSFVLSSVTSMVVGTLASINQQDVMAFNAFLDGFANLVAGLVIFWREKWTVHALGFAGSVYLISWIGAGWVGRHPNTDVIGSNVKYGGFANVFLSVFITVYRYLTVWRAQNLVREDLKVYNRAWDDVCRVPENVEAIRELCERVRTFPSPTGSERQYNRAAILRANISKRSLDASSSRMFSLTLSGRMGSFSSDIRQKGSFSSDIRQTSETSNLLSSPLDGGMTKDGGDSPGNSSLGSINLWRNTLAREPWLRGGMDDEDIDKLIDGCPGVIDPSSPVDSIDQLYAQAAGLDSVLLRFTQSWALASNGYFFKTGGGLVRWRDAAANLQAAPEIKWGTMKSPKRAIEKLVRAYKGNVSQLLDLCRQSIVFETVSELLACLQIVMQDPSVVVVRIKNRLELQYNGEETAGYRDVSVNLRLDNDVTRDLGVETHVCELKLLLNSFALLKSDKGHKNYVQSRNIRGE